MGSVTYEEVVSQIKDRLDIVDVVSKDVILKKSGGNYWGLCPFHKEKTPSFSVNPAKGIYKCFGCGEGGDALSYLMKTRNIEFKALITELADEFGIELPQNYSHSNQNKGLREQMIKACAKAAEFYQHTLFGTSEAKKALDYLTNRGIDEKIIKRYSLGCALKTPKALYSALKKTFSDEILEKAGLVLKTEHGDYIDRFRNRVIIPVQDENGDIVAFGARAIEDGQNPKYLNSSDSLIYNKSKLLYGLYFAKDAIKQSDSVIIMEGYFDVISAQAHGIENCVASCGTSMTYDHIKLISRYSKSRKIYLAFDTDAAGIKATNRGAEIIKESFMGLGGIKQFDESYSGSDDKYACEIRVITPPEGKDPDEFIRNAGAEAYFKHMEHAPLLIDFQINQILKKKNTAKSPTEKSKLAKEIIPVLAEIQNKIVRFEYVKIVASSLSISESALASEVKNFDMDFPVTSASKTKIVTKSSNIIEKAQKNLLSLYLVTEAPLSLEELNKMIDKSAFSDETLINVKTAIDKLVCSVNNVKALIEKLYIYFAQDEKIKVVITDLICISETFYKLTKKDFIAVVEENLNKIEEFRIQHEHAQMRDLYTNVNDNDNEALKVQMQLRDKINSLIGDN